jgi:hypothetical protein
LFDKPPSLNNPRRTAKRRNSMDPQTKITGGRVMFHLTVAPKQYESKRAEVELTFTVAEGDDYAAIFNKSCAATVNRCREIVGLPSLVEPVKPVVGALKTSSDEGVSSSKDSLF